MAAANPMAGAGAQRGFPTPAQSQPTTATGTSATTTTTTAAVSKTELSDAMLCRLGQETVQEVVAKTSDMFRQLKDLQLPNNVNVTVQAYQDRKAKLEEQARTIPTLLKRLRAIYNTVLEHTASLDHVPVEKMLPIEEHGEVKGERPKVNENTQVASKEHAELVQQLEAKNRQLKEVIDQLRTFIWEINTMMAMRKV